MSGGIGGRSVLQGQWPQYGRGAGTGLQLCALPQIVSRGLQRSVVFEDDVRFEAVFPARLQRLMEELERAQQHWDLMYVLGPGGCGVRVPRVHGSHGSLATPQLPGEETGER